MKTKPTSVTNRVEPPPTEPTGDINTNNSSSLSPPPSPRRHSTSVHLYQCRRRPPQRTKSHCFTRRDNLSAGVFLRWNFRYLLVLPLLYVSGLIMCVGSFSALVGSPLVPGSAYRSHVLFERLWPDMAADTSTTSLQVSSVWKYKRKFLKVQRPCPNSTARSHFDAVEESSGSRGFLIVEANGSLNQQRSAICNAVAVAALLNAVLVIPYLEYHNGGKDPSAFGDIYEIDHFIAILEPYVKVVEELPDELMERYDNNIVNIPNLNVKAWASANFYLREVYPVLQQQRVVRISPFANRLAMHVPSHIQLLRCIANYKALRFSQTISELAVKLVNQMIEKSSRSDGKYVSIHLRFEEDMVAFSCCAYDGGEAEKRYMDALQEKGWKGKFKRKDCVIMPGLNRVNGQCPLTPLEVGLMLRGMGFDNTTVIYVASGKIYLAERYLAPLRKMFPLLYTKESLATPDELAPFKGYSSRLAALDYSVCLVSEVFVTTEGGNFPQFLMGHRRFLFDGHSKTIKPDKRKLVLLFQEMGISWNDFKDQMETMLVDSDHNGLMVPRVRKINRKTSIYTYPLPECRCLQPPNASVRLAHTVDSSESLIGSTR